MDAKALHVRLRRIEGQVRGLQRMVEKGRDPIDVLTQLSAVGAALRVVGIGLLDDHARRSVRRGIERGDGGESDIPALIEAATRLVGM